MKKVYIKPEMKIVEFRAEDIITTSTAGPANLGEKFSLSSFHWFGDTDAKNVK